MILYYHFLCALCVSVVKIISKNFEDDCDPQPSFFIREGGSPMDRFQGSLIQKVRTRRLRHFHTVYLSIRFELETYCRLPFNTQSPCHLGITFGPFDPAHDLGKDRVAFLRGGSNVAQPDGSSLSFGMPSLSISDPVETRKVVPESPFPPEAWEPPPLWAISIVSLPFTVWGTSFA
jgi:hypothetical protein